MNQLPLAKRVQIINMLVEGSSLRSTSRVCDVSINTVTKLLVDVGRACERFHDETVRKVTVKNLQCDEIWSYVYAKQKNVTDEMEAAGDVWTWTALDSDTKLMVSWYAGARDAHAAYEFLCDIRSRVDRSRMQLTTDGHGVYKGAVDAVFGQYIDYAQLVKIYGNSEGKGNEKRYSPAECTGAKLVVVTGQPDETLISTSHVERQNLTIRMGCRRFTRLTNAFSKKFENHCLALALHFVYYNFCRIHKTLRVTPSMEAGLTDDVMKLEEVVALIDRYKAEPSN